MMSDNEALLRGIFDNPDDDTPRLIYADYLDEHDQPDRAEFIRLQCQLARLTGDEDGHRLEVRANEILGRYDGVWVGQLRDLVNWYHFRRGFVGEVGVDAQTFLQRSDELFRLAPIRGAFIGAVATELPGLTASPYLARLSVLRLLRVNDSGAELLAQSPQVAGIEELDLPEGSIGSKGAESLAHSPYMGRLKTLRLTRNSLGYGGLQALSASKHLPQLSTLDVSNNFIVPGEIEALAASPLVAQLNRL